MGFLDRFRRPKSATDPDGFRELALEVARAHPFVASVELAEDGEFALSVSFVGGDGSVRTTYLRRPWAEAEGEPYEDQVEIIARFLEQFAQEAPIPKSWSDAKDLVFLGLRAVSYTAYMPRDKAPIWREALDGLALILFVDLETTAVTVRGERLEEWGVSVNDAWVAAAANTLRMAPDAGDFAPTPKSMVRISSGQIDAASYLTAPGWLASMARGMSVVAWAAERDSLAVVFGAEGVDPTRFAAQALETWKESPTDVSPRLYTLDGDTVAPLTAPQDDPASRALEKCRYAQIARATAEQGHALEVLHERDGIDGWVGVLDVLDRNGRLEAVTIWPDDVVTLLPEADTIDFVEMDKNEKIRVVHSLPQRAVFEAMGLEPEADLVPPRYYVARWPDTRLLERLAGVN